MVGRMNRGGLTTHVERKTHYLVAGRVANKQANTFATITNQLLGWISKSPCHTLTLDKGTENAPHTGIADAKTMPIDFAHPRAP